MPARRCPNCQFSYAWDGEFCGHCHIPYPRRGAWATCTEPHWFCRHHRTTPRRQVLFGCACVRTVLRFLPTTAGALLKGAEDDALRGGGVFPGFTGACAIVRDDVHDTTPSTSPARAAADALALLGAAVDSSDPTLFFNAAYLVATAQGLAAIAETADERAQRPAFLDDRVRQRDPAFRRAVQTGRQPSDLSFAEEAQWDAWQLATQRAGKTRQTRSEATRTAAAALCDLYRDVVAYPFAPVRFDAVWRTDTAAALAREVLATRDPAAMPVLADALQEAGCDEEAVLQHCRDAGPHVPGCWVLDLVLGTDPERPPRT